MNDQTTPTLDEAVARMNAGMAALRVALDALLPLTERPTAARAVGVARQYGDPRDEMDHEERAEARARALDKSQARVAELFAENGKLRREMDRLRDDVVQNGFVADGRAHEIADLTRERDEARARIAELEAAQGAAEPEPAAKPVPGEGQSMTVRVHEIAVDGLPPLDTNRNFVGRVAFLFDGCIATGWPLTACEDFPDQVGPDGRILWEADTDVTGGLRRFAGVTHWLEFPAPLHTIGKRTPARSDLGDFPVGYTIGCAVPGCRVEWTVTRVADGSWRAEADANPRKMVSATPGPGYPDPVAAGLAARSRAVTVHASGLCACEPGASHRGATWSVALAPDGKWAVRVNDAPLARVEGLDAALETARARAAEARP